LYPLWAKLVREVREARLVREVARAARAGRMAKKEGRKDPYRRRDFPRWKERKEARRRREERRESPHIRREERMPPLNAQLRKEGRRRAQKEEKCSGLHQALASHHQTARVKAPVMAKIIMASQTVMPHKRH